MARWQSIVAEVLDDVSDLAACFRTLYDHFARPESWRVDPDAPPALREIARRGLAIGVCSNFDHRLRGLVAAMPELADIHHVVISSEVGWKKPAAGFFAEVARTVGMPPQSILIVGDDAVNDYEGARAAGLPALLLDPHARAATAERITRLRDLAN